MDTGVYVIEHVATGKQYVGSAVSFYHRWRTHRWQLRQRTHANRHLQRAWTKYGEEAFTFTKLLVCAPQDLLLYEQLVLDKLNPAFNIARTAGSTLGVTATPQQRRNLSKARQVWVQDNPRAHAAVSSKAHDATRQIWGDPTRKEQRLAAVRDKIVAKLSQHIEFNGRTQTRAQWAAEIGVTPSTLSHRLNKWGVEAALTTPASGKHSRESHLLRIQISNRGTLYTYNGKQYMLTELAALLGTTRQAFLWYMRRHGFDAAVDHYKNKAVA